MGRRGVCRRGEAGRCTEDQQERQADPVSYQSQEEQQQEQIEAVTGSDQEKRAGEVIGTVQGGARFRSCEEEAEVSKDAIPRARKAEGEGEHDVRARQSDHSRLAQSRGGLTFCA